MKYKEEDIPCPLCGTNESGIIFNRRLFLRDDGVIPMKNYGRTFHETNRIEKTKNFLRELNHG